MDKKYTEIEFGLGWSLERAVKELIEYAVKGEFVYGEFNGHVLYSDTVSMDSAYLEVVGRTYREHKDSQRKWREEYDRREREHKENIPQLEKEWIAKGHDALSEDKWELWDKCVPIRLNDLYKGIELGQCLDVIEKLKENNFQEAKEVMENQGHSGMSWALMKSMLMTFADNGEEFVSFLDD